MVGVPLREHGGQQARVHVGVDARAAPAVLVADHVALAQELGLAHRVALVAQAQRGVLHVALELLGGARVHVVGLVLRGVGVEGQRVLGQVRHELGRALAVHRHLEHQVLHEVGHARLALGVLARAHLLAHVELHQAGVGIGHHEQGEAVVVLLEEALVGQLQLAIGRRQVGLVRVTAGLARAAGRERAEQRDGEPRSGAAGGGHAWFVPTSVARAQSPRDPRPGRGTSGARSTLCGVGEGRYRTMGLPERSIPTQSVAGGSSAQQTRTAAGIEGSRHTSRR